MRIAGRATAVLAALVLAGCAAIGLPNVAETMEGDAATPVIPRSTDLNGWRNGEAAELRTAFARDLYGAMPLPAEVSISTRTPLDPAPGGAGVFEQWRIEVSGPIKGARIDLVVALPRRETGPAPVILMQTFCGNPAAFPGVAGVAPPRGAPGTCSSGAMGPVARAIFGDAIFGPPVERTLAAGYGVALMYTGDIVPDDAVAAASLLDALTPAGTPPDQRTGALAAWAWTYLRALDALATDPRIDAARIVLWGHSRNGKAALLAAAMDPRPAAVIALQSGTGGASLGRDDVGETIAQITQAYPHWFGPRFADWASRQSALPVDQHQLLALIAPRPILLGAGRRDRWSDPHGALRAAHGAAPVYELYGAPPFRQTRLDRPDQSHPLVTYMRPGLHGVHSSDWDQAIAFLDVQLRKPAPP
jgi:hypothetical protein